MPAPKPWRADDPDTLDRAADLVRRGEILCYPTTTVYGLGCDPTDEEAVARIREIKGRDPDEPLLVITDEWSRVADWIRGGLDGLSDAHRRLMERIPPLAVTLLLEAEEEAVSALRGSSSEVGVRATADPFCRALVARAGTPLVSTSANSSGQPAPSRFEDVEERILGAVDGAVAARRPLGGTASTVARVRDGKVEVLREGAAKEEELVRLAEGG